MERDLELHSEKGFSFLTAVAFCLNYIIGCGFLTLPWAFVEVGIIPSLILLIMMGLFAISSSIYTLEAMARANTIHQYLIPLRKQLGLQGMHIYGAYVDETKYQRYDDVGSEIALSNLHSRFKNVEQGQEAKEIERTPIQEATYGSSSSTIISRENMDNSELSVPLPENVLINRFISDLEVRHCMSNDPVSESTPLIPGGASDINALGHSIFTSGTVSERSPVARSEFASISTKEMEPSLYYNRILLQQQRQYEKYINSDGATGNVEGGVIPGINSNEEHTDHVHMTTPPLHRVGKKSYEVAELCQLFLGKWGKVTYTILVGLYLYGTLTAYATVFAKSLSERIHIFDHSMDTSVSAPPSTSLAAGVDYYVYLIIFTSIVAPLSCMELKEQVIVQVILSLCRVLMLVLMIGTIWISTYYCASVERQCGVFGDYVYHPSSANSILYDMDLSKVYELLPLLGYAFIMHHSIPALSHPVDRDIVNALPASLNTYSLHHVFVAAMAICTLSYGLVGVVVGLYFRDAVSTTANLNWLHYGEANGSVLRMISCYIVLFPALDVASAFPLNAITLGNSLCSYFTQGSKNQNRGSSVGYLYDSDESAEVNDDEDNATAPQVSSEQVEPKVNIIIYRLIAVLPAVLVAATGYDLTVITQFTGVCGFYIAYVIPALLSLYSERKLIRRYGIINTNTICTFGVEELRSSSQLQTSGFVCGALYNCLHMYGYVINAAVMKYFTVISGCLLSVYVTYSLISSL